MYPVLDMGLYEKRISRATVASRIGVTARTFSNKMNGKSPFTWNEVQTIRKEFFPDVPIEELFRVKTA